MVNGIWLIITGVVALLAATRPSPGELTVGRILLVIAALMVLPLSGLWGVWGVISAILNIGWLTTWPIYWLTWLLSSMTQVGLGGAATAMCVLDLMRSERRAPFALMTRVLGIAALPLGVWHIAATMLFR